MEKLYIKRNYEDAMIPTQAYLGDAGWDLYAYDDAEIKSGETVKIETGISVALPENTFGAIYARSGLATKEGLRPANCTGVVDSKYRGPLIVALHNDSSVTKFVHKGDKIAQMVIQNYVPAIPEVVSELDATDRGEKGFGSSGK